ncbi:hypothetical protein Zm00014a_041233, partial [Zea mays]
SPIEQLALGKYFAIGNFDLLLF